MALKTVFLVVLVKLGLEFEAAVGTQAPFLFVPRLVLLQKVLLPVVIIPGLIPLGRFAMGAFVGLRVRGFER